MLWRWRWPRTGGGAKFVYLGEIGSDAESVRRLVAKLEKRHGRLHFCHEAGPTDYGLYRQLTTLGHQCTVVAPGYVHEFWPTRRR